MATRAQLLAWLERQLAAARGTLAELTETAPGEVGVSGLAAGEGLLEEAAGLLDSLGKALGAWMAAPAPPLRPRQTWYQRHKARVLAEGGTTKEARRHLSPFEALADPIGYRHYLMTHDKTLKALVGSEKAQLASAKGQRKEEDAGLVPIDYLSSRPSAGEHWGDSYMRTPEEAQRVARAAPGYGYIVRTDNGWRAIFRNSTRRRSRGTRRVRRKKAA